MLASAWSPRVPSRPRVRLDTLLREVSEPPAAGVLHEGWVLVPEHSGVPLAVCPVAARSASSEPKESQDHDCVSVSSQGSVEHPEVAVGHK
eukprot:9527076-Alexandrium_andersonii.AAC.1